MLASWYGVPFHGRKTASGALFDKEMATAAHKTLKFGTRLHLYYATSKRHATVTVNDRGPYFGERELDVSESVARMLGMWEKGVVWLDVKQLPSQGLVP